ncbi:MAG TPA: nucleoside recognition domain-containing protein, partial [Candidatus Rifleibacterium sp.]|nr:nucleoside recognition domain-containing protein [Candidatus Rifleibacterium sp.]
SVVSTLTVLYLPYDDDLGVGMRKTGMTPLVAFVFMLFTLLYIPCIATLGVVWRESGSTRFTALAMLVYLAIAYLVSYAALKIGETINSQTSAVETITIILAACGAGWYLLRCLLNAFVGRKCKTCTSCSACPNKSSNCSGG